MTEQELNQQLAQGNVGFPESVPQEPEQLQPFTPDEYQSLLEALRRPKQVLTATPTFIPKDYSEQLQFVDDGITKSVYVYVSGTWLPIGSVVTEFDMFRRFIDIVHWTALGGFTSTISLGATAAANDGSLTMSTASTSGSSIYLYSKNRYVKICETGKPLSVEWQVAYINNPAVMQLYMTDDTSAPISNGSHHFGFKIKSGFYYATTGNGTTETETQLEAPLNGIYARKRLKAVLTRGTDCKFYIDGVLVATHTTNLPATNDLYLNMGISVSTATQFDLWLNRILIQKEY